MHEIFLPIIKAGELLKLHGGGKEIIIVDASSGKHAAESYSQKHLDGALHIDLDTQLADIKSDAANGGRHPLPAPSKFSETLINFGIEPGSHVVIYDNKNASNAAARFWWMLRSAGIEKVQVLDGGLEAALSAGFPVNSDKAQPLKTELYFFERWLLPMANIREVEKVSEDKNFLVIDVRDSERYRGEKEPIDLIAGHIPGAVNIPFSTNLDANGFYLPALELKEKYLKAFADKKPGNVIVHCGSGVTACHTLLAIAQAGLEIPKLYVGSWSEWSRNELPVARG